MCQRKGTTVQSERKKRRKLWSDKSGVEVGKKEWEVEENGGT